MKAYWLRTVMAFVLLKVASRIMKDAEQVLTAANQKPPEVVTEVTRNNGTDVVSESVDV